MELSSLAGSFTLMSEDFIGQAAPAHYYNGFGCTGANQSPHLRWVNPPKGTQSFAVTMYDPDAPTGSGFWHWLVFNLPSTAQELEANATTGMPAGAVQSKNDYGIYGYGGPCPPTGHGPHAYVVTVWALDVPSLDLSADTQPAVVGFNLHAHVIQKASIVVYGQR